MFAGRAMSTTRIDAAGRRTRDQEITRRISLTVGTVRVLFCGIFLALAAWLVPSMPRWAFWAYLACAGAVLGWIYSDLPGRSVRAFLIGLCDVAALTYLAHGLGSYSFAVVGYPLQGVLYAIAVGPRIAGALSGVGAIAYVGLLAAESQRWIVHAPYAPEWLQSTDVAPPLAALGIGGTVAAITAVATGAAILLTQRLAAERQLSESLLLNVLPASIAERLKDSADSIAERFDEATVLFADVAGFTPLSSRLAPEQVVQMLGEIFSRFDALAERHGLEKIKTIGDAYMMAGGLPGLRADHAEAVATMALEMAEVAAGWQTPTGDPLALRIGIHCGPVVAGVIGWKKFSYDLWGDTVNTASRMESHGAAGRIHVSSAVHEKLSSTFEFEDRGEVEIKGKGPMRTYFLVGPRR